MSVSATFKNSKMNALINMLIDKYGVPEDYDQIIAQGIAEGHIHTSKAKEPKNSNETKVKKSTGDRSFSKYTAFLKWCKIFAVWEGIKISRKEMKEIYKNYSEEELKAWQEVADQLKKGMNIRDIPNKPEIKVPDMPEDEASGSESEPESGAEDEPEDEPAVEEPAVEEPVVEKPVVEEPAVEEPVVDEFNQIDTNGDGVISREEHEAHKVQQKEELESRLAAAVASADYQLAGEIQKSIANLG